MWLKITEGSNYLDVVYGRQIGDRDSQPAHVEIVCGLTDVRPETTVKELLDRIRKMENAKTKC